MKMPTPNPVGRGADTIREDVAAAVEREAWSEAVSLSVSAMLLIATNICKACGIPAPRTADSSLLNLCCLCRDACDNHLASVEDDARVVIARDAFDAIATVQAVHQERSGDLPPAEFVARLLLIGSKLGQADASLALVTSGILAQYGDVVVRLYNVGGGRRGHVPPWETAFLPTAVAYCKPRSKVSLGELVRKAQKLAKAEIAAGRNPAIPATEDGIKKGIKQMEKRGLEIPGRQGR